MPEMTGITFMVQQWQFGRVDAVSETTGEPHSDPYILFNARNVDMETGEASPQLILIQMVIPEELYEAFVNSVPGRLE